MDFGNRADGTKKGSGYFGVIKRPDGNVMSEVSIGVSLEGKETLLPLIVPTLNKQEMDYLMRNDPKSKTFMSKLPSTIIDKAVDHAVMRMKEGKSPFADPNEPVAKLPR
jgi:hypothetical protein